MVATIAEIRTWLGITIDVIPDDSMQECLNMATEYVQSALTARGVGIGGQAYDIALRYMTAVNVWRRLDIMAIKPSGLSVGGLSINSDLDSAISKFEALADQAIENAVKINAPSKTDLYIRHIRSGKVSR
ncbi:MAG: hypothetical protein WC936_06105 [Candidatus Nanoarchaeia archaeon]|jgi:hypothetical protein